MKCEDAKMTMLRMPSLPVRGAWVEIDCLIVQPKTKAVAPRAGSVG